MLVEFRKKVRIAEHGAPRTGDTTEIEYVVWRDERQNEDLEFEGKGGEVVLHG